MLSHPFIRLCTRLLAAACLVSPVHAMTFTLIDPVDLPGSGMRPSHMILASGPIMPGDSQVFEAFMAELPPTDHDAGVQWGIALDSPGGSLPEGVRLGEAFRAQVVTTVVLNGHVCESACAVAYLGGAAAYAVSLATERLLQPGGRLGFHGFAVAEGTVAAANETLELARVTNAVIRDYAIRMGVEDDGLVQSLFNTPPEAMEYVDTAREILGLGVTLTVDEIRPPAGWAVNVCRHSLGEMLRELRMLEQAGRVSDRAERLETTEAFRRALLDARASFVGGLLDALADAPASTAIDVLAGRPLSLDQSAVDIWYVALERGSGFYYDGCFAVGGDWALTTIVVDEVVGDARVDSYGMLHGFPADQPLW